MRIGILSDSHGHVETTRAAVAALVERGAQVLIHLGDVGSDSVLEELAGHPSHIVFGNCDLDERSLASYARDLGLQVDHPIGTLEAAGRRIAFTHGHLAHLMQKALAEKVDYLLHGHSHTLRDERIGPTRVINPGALHRAARYTAAVLEPASDALTIVEVAPPRRR